MQQLVNTKLRYTATLNWNGELLTAETSATSVGKATGNVAFQWACKLNCGMPLVMGYIKRHRDRFDIKLF